MNKSLGIDHGTGTCETKTISLTGFDDRIEIQHK